MRRGIETWARLACCKKGSAGIESILWGIGFLMILVMPFLCFMYEQYAYSLESMQACAALSESIERIQYYVSTEELSAATVVVKREQFEEALTAALIQRLKCSDTTRTVLDVKVSYGQNTSNSGVKDSECHVLVKLGICPSTFVGTILAESNGLISMAVESRVVLPINQ